MAAGETIDHAATIGTAATIDHAATADSRRNHVPT
jgi:hypothetical protein